MNLKIFTTPTCVKCKAIKRYLEGVDVEVEYVDATTPEGKKLASEAGVMSAPTILVFDDGKQIGTAHDMDELEEYL